METLTDDDLLVIAKNSDLKIFLAALKANEKQYREFDALLGRKDLRSQLTKKNLPLVAVKLYKRRDPNFVDVFEKQANAFASMLVDLTSSTKGSEVSKEDIKKLSDTEFAELLEDFIQGDGNNLDMDLFWVQLKLIGLDMPDDRKNAIIGALDFDEKEEEITDDVSSNGLDGIEDKGEIIKPKFEMKEKKKKLTAEEKAAKTKAANEKKKKEKQAEVEAPDDEEFEEIEIEKPAEEKKEMDLRKEEMVNTSGLIGRIDIISSFYNFTPIARFENGVPVTLTENEIDAMLPLSQKNNINLYYNFLDNTHVKFMSERYKEGQLMVLDCDVADMEENRMLDGSINATGYKVPAIDYCKNGIIRFMSDAGLYRLIRKEELLDNIEGGKRIIRLRNDNLSEGEKVLLNVGDGFYAGPFETKYSATIGTYTVTVRNNDNYYYISGYKMADCAHEWIESQLDSWNNYSQWSYYRIKQGAEVEYKDVISDGDLLREFGGMLDAEKSKEGKLDIDAILQHTSESGFVGKDIPESIIQARFNRVKEILSNENRIDSSIDEVSELIFGILMRDKSTERTENLLASIVEKHPEIIEKLHGVKAIQYRVDSAKKELEQLEARKTDIQNAPINNRISKYSDEVISGEISAKKKEYDEICDQLNVAHSVKALQEKSNELKKDVTYYESHKLHLMNDSKDLESNFVELINGYSERMADVTFDGFMSSRMLKAAAEWEEKNDQDRIDEIVNSFDALESDPMSDDELIEYVVQTVQAERPGYSKNLILNMTVCLTQGFLTVFSGLPGCGKTSICNILGKVLGLTDYTEASTDLMGVKRYIPVSVERGWTSKRDFIGYYNPLTKKFEESNREVFDAVRLLDAEYKHNSAKYPFVILLDEANLSPMEYYWADFMNVCDDIKISNTINLGNDNIFNMPETLHFVATINNDHTTEILSPRLIDRAWIISLPKNNYLSYERVKPSIELKNVRWVDLKRVFAVGSDSTESFDRSTQAIYDGIREKLSKQNLTISPRVDIAIHNYWRIAESIMIEDEYGNQPNAVALDYAVVQRVLPKLMGSGEEYEAWLTDLQKYCNDNNLINSANAVSDMIQRGNKQMKYYRFFD